MYWCHHFFWWMKMYIAPTPWGWCMGRSNHRNFYNNFLKQKDKNVALWKWQKVRWVISVWKVKMHQKRLEAETRWGAYTSLAQTLRCKAGKWREGKRPNGWGQARGWEWKDGRDGRGARDRERRREGRRNLAPTFISIKSAAHMQHAWSRPNGIEGNSNIYRPKHGENETTRHIT